MTSSRPVWAMTAIIVDTGAVRTTRLLTLDQRHFRRLRPLWEADHPSPGAG